MTPSTPPADATLTAPSAGGCTHILPLYTAHLCTTCRDLRDAYRTALRPPPERKATR